VCCEVSNQANGYAAKHSHTHPEIHPSRNAWPRKQLSSQPTTLGQAPSPIISGCLFFRSLAQHGGGLERCRPSTVDTWLSRQQPSGGAIQPAWIFHALRLRRPPKDSVIPFESIPRRPLFSSASDHLFSKKKTPTLQAQSPIEHPHIVFAANTQMVAAVNVLEPLAPCALADRPKTKHNLQIDLKTLPVAQEQRASQTEASKGTLDKLLSTIKGWRPLISL
jgi:hypothetical protein